MGSTERTIHSCIVLLLCTIAGVCFGVYTESWLVGVGTAAGIAAIAA